MSQIVPISRPNVKDDLGEAPERRVGLIGLSSEALFDVIQVGEVSVDVLTRNQLEAWIRGPVNTLIPHTRVDIWMRLAEIDEWRGLRCECAGKLRVQEPISSQPERRLVEQLHTIWERAGYAPVVIEADTPLARAIGLDGASLGLVHGVCNLFGHRCVFLFVSNDCAKLRSAGDFVELLAGFVLLAALRAVEGSGRFLDRRPSGIAQGSRPTLTAREVRILECVREGKTNQEIGAALHISEFTVKSHLQRIFRKLGVGNRIQAVSTAFSYRFLGPKS